MLTDKHLEELAACLQTKTNLSLSRLNLSNNKLTYKGAQLLFSALIQSNSKINNIILDKTNLEKPNKVDASYSHFCRSLQNTLSLNRELIQLSLNFCNLSTEVMTAIGEGLLKNTKLKSLGLRGNQMKLKDLTSFISSCRGNKKLAL